MNTTGTTKYAYCNLPEDKVAYYLSEEDNLDAIGQDAPITEEENMDPDIIHYNIETHGGIVSITYDLDEDATIGIIVASHMGVGYKYKTWTQGAGTYTPQIDCNGLRPGTYILYINVNGKVYSEKITL